MAAAGSALRLAERLAQRVGGLTEAQTEELGRALVDCGLGEAALEAAQARLAPPSIRSLPVPPALHRRCRS